MTNGTDQPQQNFWERTQNVIDKRNAADIPKPSPIVERNRRAERLHQQIVNKQRARNYKKRSLKHWLIGVGIAAIFTALLIGIINEYDYQSHKEQHELDVESCSPYPTKQERQDCMKDPQNYFPGEDQKPLGDD